MPRRASRNTIGTNPLDALPEFGGRGKKKKRNAGVPDADKQEIRDALRLDKREETFLSRCLRFWKRLTSA